MIGDDAVKISARDFGRMEGKVDAIADDVKVIKTGLTEINGRVVRLETTSEAKVRRKEEAVERESQEEQALQTGQLSRQTWILLGSLMLMAVATAVGWIGWMWK